MAKQGLLSRLFSTTTAAVGRKVGWWDAGMYTRRLRGVPTQQVSVNEMVKRYGKTIVARSRWLTANNPYAAAAKDAFVTAFVGAGIIPSSLFPDQKKAIQDLWNEWTDESDADGLTDFYGQQAVIAAEIFEAGECFVRFRDRLPQDNLSVPLQLQILPSEMLDVNYNTFTGDLQNQIICGIEFGPIGNRVAYWFWKFHPAEQIPAFGQANIRVRVPASEVLHLYKPRQAGQMRGVPHTLPSIVRTAIFDMYDDAELERKKTAALFVGAIVRDLPADDDEHPLEAALPDENGLIQAPSNFPDGSTAALEPGALFDLQPGEKMQFSEPSDVGATYEPFQLRNLLAIAAGYGVPYADMTGDLRQTSYGSIRAGLVNFRRKVEMMQHHIMIFQFCRPVWARWMTNAVLDGAIPISPSFFQTNYRKVLKARWMAPKWDWIDPLKDLAAEKVAVDNGFKSRSDVVEANGYDPEENDQRISDDKQREERLQLHFPVPVESVRASTTDTEGLDSATDDPSVDDPPSDEPTPDPLKARGEAAIEARMVASAERQETNSLLRQVAGRLVEVLAAVQSPKEAPPQKIVVNLPSEKRGKQRTKVLKHDKNGRIMETETEFVEEEEIDNG